MANKLSIKKPNALVFIYNYKDRTGDTYLESDPHAIDQTILNSHSLKSISTQKSKSNPAGAFEIRLAPYKNWVAAITPGSWCLILMSNYELNDKAKYGGGKVDEKSFKMLGRIESVRGVTNTNQTTGARETEYIVTGSDWGCIFNSKLYVDPLNRAPNENAVGMPERFKYDKYLDQFITYEDKKLGKDKSPNSKVNYPTPKKNIDFFLSLWGRSDPATSYVKEESGIMAKSQQVFRMPSDLAKYMGFIDANDNSSPVIAQILKTYYGKLEKYDTYEDRDYSIGIIDPGSIFGEHSIWQLINDNSNKAISEVLTDIRFEQGIPKLALYNRAFPFAINNLEQITKDSSIVDDEKGAVHSDIVERYVSPFKNIRTIKIAKEDVVLSSFGTNWRDRINFIEVLLSTGHTLYKESFNSAIKLNAQFIDEQSISRDGLLSMLMTSAFIPSTKDEVPDPLGVLAYKYILKECFFNTHKMLNGTLNLIGQDQYIQVGDNIMVDSSVLSGSDNFNDKQFFSDKRTYLLAHVESISHQSGVDNNGARSFMTSINFVRGIIVDKNRNIINNNDVGAVDQDASKMTPSIEVNQNNLNSSTSIDPDKEKPIINDITKEDKEE